MKAGVRDLFIKELNLDWDTPLPEKLRKIWEKYVVELVTAGKMEFSRCVKPEEPIEDFWLIIFWDGSDQAFAAAVYCRWSLTDGKVVVRLL